MLIIGTGFDAGTTVSIGGVPIAMISLAPKVILCVAPPGSPGPTQSVVTTSCNQVSWPYSYL